MIERVNGTGYNIVRINPYISRIFQVQNHLEKTVTTYTVHKQFVKLIEGVLHEASDPEDDWTPCTVTEFGPMK